MRPAPPERQRVTLAGRMDHTPLLHKPVFYGGELANLAFVVLLVVHAACGATGVISGVFALAAQKGKRVHLRAGRWFVRAMVATALTGIALDGVRLGSHYAENHTKYAGLTMPSTIPARIGFLFAALCILYLARVGTHPRVFSRRPSPIPAWERALPLGLLVAAVAAVAFIALRLNPWTGAIWMIVTFAAATIATGRMSPSVAQHRFAMLFLAAFSWWGAVQGFGPAIGVAIRGVDASTRPYLGDQPGPFDPAFFGFLAVWAPAFVIAAVLHRRFARRAVSAA